MTFKVSDGEINIRNAKKVYSDGVKSLVKNKSCEIDLTAVEQLDTAGVSVLIALWQYGLKNSVECHFKASQQVEAALRVYNIELP